MLISLGCLTRLLLDHQCVFWTGVAGSMKDVDIYLFESTDGKRWKWRSKAASGMSSAGEEGANENDMVVAAGKEPNT